jgi:hypothetical protein
MCCAPQDELRLLFVPVVVGSGRHLIDRITEPLLLKLIAPSAFTTGVLSLTCESPDQRAN